MSKKCHLKKKRKIIACNIKDRIPKQVPGNDLMVYLTTLDPPKLCICPGVDKLKFWS